MTKAELAARAEAAVSAGKYVDLRAYYKSLIESSDPRIRSWKPIAVLLLYAEGRKAEIDPKEWARKLERQHIDRPGSLLQAQIDAYQAALGIKGVDRRKSAC